MPPKVGTVQMPEKGSAAVQAQDFLGDDVSVVSAFQNVGAQHLQEDHAIECDVLFYFRNDNISLFKQVIKHPQYQANPFATINEHLQNKLKQEEEMGT